MQKTGNEDIIDYDWNESSLKNRMPKDQRAKIFLPFSALAGYDDALAESLALETEKMTQTRGELLDDSLAAEKML